MVCRNILFSKEMLFMKLERLIYQYKSKLNSDNYDSFSVLLFALQLPSICSRLEFSFNEYPQFYNGNEKSPKDKKLYKEWIKKHNYFFKELFYTAMTIETFADILYNFRCQTTHEGSILSNNSKIYFIDNNNKQVILLIGDAVFISNKAICEDLFNAALYSLKECNKNPKVSLSKELFISDDIYQNIKRKVKKTFENFWEKHTEEEKRLYQNYCLYLLNNEFLYNFLKESFDLNSNFEYQLSNDCILSKNSFKKMLKIAKENDLYCKNNHLDMNDFMEGQFNEK